MDEFLAGTVLQRKALTLDLVRELKKSYHNNKDSEKAASLAKLYEQLTKVS